MDYNILIVEDEIEICDAIEIYLKHKTIMFLKRIMVLKD